VRGGRAHARGPSRGLGSVIRRSAAWSTVDVAVVRFGQFAQGVIVARLLAPRDFGVFAVALVVHAIIVNVSDLGIGSALIRAPEEAIDRTAPTVVAMAWSSGIALGVGMALLAPVLSRLLRSPGATGPIQVMSLTLPLAGLTVVPGALMRREFRMDRIFVADALNTVTSGVVVIVLAVAGWGPMALAWSWVAGQVLTTVVFFAYEPGRRRPAFDRVVARGLLSYGLPLGGANIVTFLILNVDYIIIGRTLGATALGLYVLAFNISGWPMNVFGAVVRSVSLPAFARLQREGTHTADHLVTALRLVATITFPVCLVLGGLAHPLISAVYGRRWQAASGALVGLSVLGAGRIVIELWGDFLISLGRTRAVFAAQFPWLVALTVGITLVVHPHGIGGVGAVQAVVVIVVVAPTFAFFLAHAGVRPMRLMGALLPPLVVSLAAAAAAWSVARLIANPVLACLGGGVVALAVLGALGGPLLAPELRRLWRQRATLTDSPAGDAGPSQPAAPVSGTLTAEAP